MTRISQWTSLFIGFFSLLCIPLVSDAITVTISEVSSTWKPEASTSSNLSVAWVNVTISDIDPNKDQYKVIQITLQHVTDYVGICCNSLAQDITDTGLEEVYNNSEDKDLIFREEENGEW